MRRVVQLALAFALCVASAQAQETISYDFEDGLMPEDFTLYNVDMLTPADEGDIGWLDTAWIVTTSSRFEGFAALSISWYEDENGNEVGPADDWMILPRLQLGAGAELNFLVRSATTSGDFPDDYQVLINTGEATVESFGEDGEILWTEEAVESDDWQDRSLDLSAYAGQSVHIAFRNVTNTNGYGLWIDNIEVSQVITSSVREVDNEAFNMALTPNPAGRERVLLSYTLEEASQVSLSVRDMAGRTLMALPQGIQPAGNNQARIDVSNLASGTYIVSIRSDKKIGTAKMIVRH
ncbi:MAG: choice-of-anchor J domain-containing protein [Phaeodactylibacter sp.]|nr:choice-of-anchor J domain-containing protein [Phaeodactylibacter sp.]